MTPSPDATSGLRIALLEDDAALRDRILLPGLSNFGFVATGMATAVDLHDRMQSTTFDIVVLDVGLPDADGFVLAGELRAGFPDIGIVMLTGRGETPDRVRGLSQGADAYLSKPVEIELLAATLHSLSRRLQSTPASALARHWHLDADGWCLVSPKGCAIALTKAERRVMGRLTHAPGQLVTREELIAALTDNVHDFDPHRLDSLIHRLRRKIAECGETLPLTAVHGEGYVLQNAH